MTRFAALALALTLVAAPLAAGDDPPPAPGPDPAAVERQAKVSVEYFKKEFKGDTGRKINAMLELSRVKHDLVVHELGKRGLRDPDAEVRDAAAQLLAEMPFNSELAGTYLRDNLAANEEFPEVQVSIIRGLGKLKFKDCIEPLKDAAKRLNEEKYRWVTVEVVRTMGILADPACLTFLLWLAEYGGVALKWATGEVTVDTGASGDVDQKAAEAAWQAKYGHVKPKRPPAPIIKAYMQELELAVEKITGQKFASSKEFREWLEAHAKELGISPKDLKQR